MFYFLISKLVKGDTEMRLRTIYILGSICYIILHAFLYRKQSAEYLVKYRHYMYYLCIIDVILTGTYMYMTNKTSSSNTPAITNTVQTDSIPDNKPNLSNNKPVELPVSVETKPEQNQPANEQQDEGTYIPLYEN